MINTAYINIWDSRVGAVAYNPDTQECSFEYDPDFLKLNLDLSPIEMPITDSSGKIYSFPDLIRSTTFRGLPGLLADILPDNYGKALINAWLIGQKRPSDSLNPVELLCFIGKRGMGALEIDPPEPKSNQQATKVEIEGLVNIAQKILSKRQTFHTNIDSGSEKALYDIFKIGTSTGGARAKALIAYNEKTGDVKSGQAGAPKGYNHWIIKLDGVTDEYLGSGMGYGRIEMAYYLMAVDAGITMTKCKLLEENKRAHFMTRRFDRMGSNGKLHVQSFCALRHYDFRSVEFFSYEQLFETMRYLNLPYKQVEQLYRRMVFNVMGCNNDDHTKNFSFIMDKYGKWNLSPAFDVSYSYNPDSIWVGKHALSINGKRDSISKADLLEVASRNSIKKPIFIIQEISDIFSNWNYYAGNTNVAKNKKQAIENSIILFK